MNLDKDLIGLRNTLFDFSKRNPFVHLQQDKVWWDIENGREEIAEKLFKKAEYYKKEYGLETTLKIAVFIKWSPPNHHEGLNQKYFISPLIYQPCSIVRERKLETIYHVKDEALSYTLNPVIQHYFDEFFNFQASEEIEDVDSFIAEFQAFFNAEKSDLRINCIEKFDDSDEWQLIFKKGIGNFNYKKSMLGLDYEKVIDSPSEQVKSLFGYGAGHLDPLENNEEFELVTSLDESQLNVLNEAMQKNVTIQGPPGTGKSHTIVGLIGAYLTQGKKVLFVSEKRSALEVVFDRLREKDLDFLTAYLNTSRNQKKTFYEKLKSNWERLNQPVQFDTNKRKKLELNERDLFDFYPSKIIENKVELGTTIQDLINILLAGEKKPKELTLKGQVPKYILWSENIEFLSRFEKQICAGFNKKTIAETPFVQLNSAVFRETGVLLKLEKRLEGISTVLAKITALQQKYRLDERLDDFVRLALTGSILNMVNKLQMDLLNTETKNYKTFNTWAKKYQVLKVKLKQAKQANDKWTRKPSLSEITELVGLLKDESERKSKPTILRILKRNPSKLTTAFTDFHSGISVHTKLKLLEGVKLEWRLVGEMEELKVKLKHNLFISNPEQEIDLIFNLRNKLDAVSQREYLKILEHENSPELIKDLSEIHPQIVQLNAQKRFIFNESEVDLISDFEKMLQVIQEALPIINHWLPELKQYFKLPSELRSLIEKNKKSIRNLNLSVTYQNLLESTRFDHEFRVLGGHELMNVQAQKMKTELLHQEKTIEAVKSNFNRVQQEAEELINIPIYKLKKTQKEKRKQYKLQKRLLLHEMNKKQQHLSIQSFFEKTREHLLKIQPLWIMNPLSVSEILPCEKELFDVVIFDESSQIPLEDAIPSVYRAKKIIVVGDAKQMPPSQFFASSASKKTILDQAESVFSNTMLKWHYRSKHPDLIRFSNNEFYNGALIAMPPKFSSNPIELNYVESVYDSGKNLIEAKSIAEYCKSSPHLNQKKITIIAFSKEQERTIGKELQKIGLKLDKLLETRNLENAQGIEADIVLLSVGYGKNDEGIFRLNFGPINKEQGANRLNVLFTRAKEKMVVFTSVRSADFTLSENKGVQLLRGFLNYAELSNQQKRIPIKKDLAKMKVEEILKEAKLDYTFYTEKDGIALSCFIQHKSNKMILVDPGCNQDEVKDVYNIISILKNQYKAIHIVLSLDLWMNYERTKSNLVEFFMES